MDAKAIGFVVVVVGMILAAIFANSSAPEWFKKKFSKKR